MKPPYFLAGKYKPKIGKILRGIFGPWGETPPFFFPILKGFEKAQNMKKIPQSPPRASTHGHIKFNRKT